MIFLNEGWTYGAEHEWADWPLDRPLPQGYKRDVRDITIVNSNGIANDPTGRFYGFGGEINTPPTDTVEGQVGCMEELQALYPEATINYRSNLHLHIRVPGLINDLAVLKRLQRRIHDDMPVALPIIEPLDLPIVRPWHSGTTPQEVLKGHARRVRRMKVSHQTLLKPDRVARQMAATTVQEFFEAEVPRSKAGAVMWHAQPRLCVNLRQLRETDTIEFRHWPGTMDADELANAFRWCKEWLESALRIDPIDDLLAAAQTWQLPRFQPYDHWMEERYRRTVHDGTIPKDQLPHNIAAILKETRP